MFIFFLIFNFVFEYQEMLGPEGPLAAGHVLGVLIFFIFLYSQFTISRDAGARRAVGPWGTFFRRPTGEVIDFSCREYQPHYRGLQGGAAPPNWDYSQQKDNFLPRIPKG